MFMYFYSLVQIFLNFRNYYSRFYIYLFINSLISVNIFKFFIIIKIVDLGFININFYMYFYTFVIKFFIYYDILFL